MNVTHCLPPAALHTAGTLPTPPGGSRAAKDLSLSVFISRPAWLPLNCPIAVTSAPQI